MSCISRRFPLRLLTLPRLVRDQANKTFDVYAQRIRKHAASLPDTVLPPSTAAVANGAMPRIGTAQNDTGWAGWAISSFTNKIATANGEMQVKPSTLSTGPSPVRSASVPPQTDSSRPAFTASTASHLHRQAVTASPAPILTRTSTDQFFGDAQEEDDEVDEAWGEMAHESFFDTPVQQKPVVEPKASAQLKLMDNGDEPDFEGWLKAQSQAKAKAALPKGLSKPSSAINGRQAASRSKITGHVNLTSGAKKLASTTTPASKLSTAKAIDTEPKIQPADDDWGDAWD